MSLPAANYVFVSSRLHPGKDGGYTVSVMRRARQFRDHGASDVQLLTFDLAADYEPHRSGFRELGLADDRTVLRNLLEEARNSPEWLLQAAHPPAETGAGAADYAEHVDSRGDVLLRTPRIPRSDWHRTSAAVEVVRDGVKKGVLDGFGELYRAWVRHVLSELNDNLPVVIIAESRQVGELLAPLKEEGVLLIHTVHNAHTLPPHDWDSDVDALWGGWLATLDTYDAVVFLTESQRRDVLRRWPTRSRTDVIPHGIEPAGTTSTAHDPRRVAMITRLAPQKRIDHAIRAVAQVVAGGCPARLDVYGDGPERSALEALIRELGVDEVVTLHGYDPDASTKVAGAAVLVLSSLYEGLPLVLAEAFRRGVPVVAYDINYGPRDMIDGTNGALVEPGNIAALAAELEAVLTDPRLRQRLSTGALATAHALGPAAVMERWASLLRDLLGRAR